MKLSYSPAEDQGSIVEDIVSETQIGGLLEGMRAMDKLYFAAAEENSKVPNSYNMRGFILAFDPPCVGERDVNRMRIEVPHIHKPLVTLVAECEQPIYENGDTNCRPVYSSTTISQFNRLGLLSETVLKFISSPLSNGVAKFTPEKYKQQMSIHRTVADIPNDTFTIDYELFFDQDITKVVKGFEKRSYWTDETWRPCSFNSASGLRVNIVEYIELLDRLLSFSRERGIK